MLSTALRACHGRKDKDVLKRASISAAMQRTTHERGAELKGLAPHSHGLI